MAKLASPAAPPVLPGALQIAFHRCQHRNLGTDLLWWPESCSGWGKGRSSGGMWEHLGKAHGRAGTPGKPIPRVSSSLLALACFPAAQHRLANRPAAAQPPV